MNTSDLPNPSSKVKILTRKESEDITNLTQFLNPDISKKVLSERLITMFTYSNYKCFGIYSEKRLIGISGAWTMTKLYCGKQLEVDHFIVHPDFHSKGIGKELLNYIESWAKQHDYSNVELNTYIFNDRSHKFYEREGYDQLGYHYVKRLSI